MDDYTLVMRIENTKFLELLTLTESLTSLGELYKDNSREGLAHNLLHIKELRIGSIEIELITFGTLPFIASFNSIYQFYNYLKTLIFNIRDNVITNYTNKELDKTLKLVEPVSKDNKGNLNINLTIKGNVSNSFNVNCKDVKIIKKNALEIASQQESDDISLRKEYSKVTSNMASG